MQNEARRLADRFQPLFDNGLTDVKFFVPSKCSLPELLEEANKIQEVIAAGEIRAVASIDGDCELRAFDAPF